jgi:hypothetical protein
MLEVLQKADRRENVSINFQYQSLWENFCFLCCGNEIVSGSHIAQEHLLFTYISGSQTSSGHLPLGSINSFPVPLALPYKYILRNSGLHKPLRKIKAIK